MHRNGEGCEDNAAENRAEVPVVGQLIVQLDRQTEHAQRQVRQRQTRHEHVRRRLQKYRHKVTFNDFREASWVTQSNVVMDCSGVFSFAGLFLPHAIKVLFLAPYDTFCFYYDCESNISGTAERICTKFTGKTCLVPRSEEFEWQGQRSKVKVTRNKNEKDCCVVPVDSALYGVRRTLQMTSSSRRPDHSVAAGG